MKPNRILLALTLFAFLLAVGCSDDDDPVTPDPGAPLVPHQDNLMPSFEAAYSDMAYEDLENLLHPDFKMFLLPETRMDWGWDPDFDFDRADFLDAHRNMFGGEQGQDSQANPVHPVAEIEIPLLEPTGPWVSVQPDDLYFGGVDGALQATYRFRVEFYNADMSHRYQVQQLIVFYAASVSGDEEDPDYRLLGVRGLPLVAKTDEASWCSVVSLYRGVTEGN